MDKELFSLSEAAEVLGVSYSWLDKKVRAGVVPHLWIGGTRKISKDAMTLIKRNGVRP